MTGRLNILVIYNDAWTHVQSTREHLEALRDRSKHKYFFLPAQETIPTGEAERLFSDYENDWPDAFNLRRFDAVVWHFVLPAYKTPERWPSEYIARNVAKALARYDGLKVIFTQDEYDGTAITWKAIRDADVQVIMTCLPIENARYAYPDDELPGVEVLETLTGYVPDDQRLQQFAIPMRDRVNRIAYRARILPHRYGTSGREKFGIGLHMRALAEARGVPVDIEWADDKRIYGDGWYRFLGSARAMLATESGSNVFDFHSDLLDEEAAAQQRPYEEYYAERLAALEAHPDMSMVSPKIFEAVSLHTALVCFEGRYSDVLEPGKHYIPLKKIFPTQTRFSRGLRTSTILKR